MVMLFTYHIIFKAKLLHSDVQIYYTADSANITMILLSKVAVRQTLHFVKE